MRDGDDFELILHTLEVRVGDDFELILHTLEVRVGDDFELTLELKNHSGQRRTLDVYVSGSVVFYTGVPSAEVIFKNPTLSVEPQSGETRVCVSVCE